MKYKIIHTYKAPSARTARKALKRGARVAYSAADLPALAGAALPNFNDEERSPADVADLFGFGGFYDPYSETDGYGTAKKQPRRRKTARARAFIWRLKMAAERQRETIVSKAAAARARRTARREHALPLSVLCGALCAILCVFALSVAFVGYRLLLKDRALRFERVEIPELVGQRYEPSALDPELFEVILNYEYDASAPEGAIIEQSPTAGVIRRVYKGGEPCRVTLTVSLGERHFVMKDYTAEPARAAELELKNEALKFRISEQYSDTVKAGHIISTTPPAGESFAADEVVTLTVSLGKERKFVAIPSLLGLTEVKARDTLRALGFDVGEIKYVASQSAAGTVVAQSASAYSLVEIGERVDLTVSAGPAFLQKKVPDLYGLTVEDARQRLAEVGLVCGQIYSVQSGSGTATVVSQSVAAGTPITSGTVSVDIYVSS